MFRLFISILTFLIFTLPSIAQDTITFESFGLVSGNYLNGASQSGFFKESNLILPNDYNKDWMTWSGWAISSKTDTITAGYTNEYSAIPGKGVSNSQTYAVAYVGSGENILKTSEAKPQNISGFYVTNSTYAYKSMKDGDAFAKRFGGITGNDPDWFKLSIEPYVSGRLSGLVKEVYLGDFRSSDKMQDHLIADWEYVDLSDLGPSDSLSLKLSSSDNGTFGMNTPAYFCIDNVTLNTSVSTKTVSENEFSVYPNPARDRIAIKTKMEIQTLSIFDGMGKLVMKSINAFDALDVTNLKNGVYLVQAFYGDEIQNVLLMKYNE